MAGSNSNNSQRLSAGVQPGVTAPVGAGANASDGTGASGNLDATTQKLPSKSGSIAAPAAEKSERLGVNGSAPTRRAEANASGGVSANVSEGLAKSESLSADLSKSGGVSSNSDSVASRRLAHGLSPEVTTKSDAAELRRKEKEASAEERKRKFQRQHKAKVVRRAIIVAVVVLIVGMLVGFWLLRWGLNDDASSIQGQWRVKGTDTVINITDEDIVLTDEVAYDYVIDPSAKTLTFTFGGLTGNGRYRFSLDHSQLAIDDGEFDWWSTLMADIPWTFDAVAQKLVGHPEKSPELGEGEMVLERMT